MGKYVNEDIYDDGSVGSEKSEYPTPLHAAAEDFHSDDDVLNWAKRARDVAVYWAKDRNENIKINNTLYKGEVSKSGAKSTGTYSRLTDMPEFHGASPQTQYIISNHLYDHTEVRVARFQEYADDIEVVPANVNEVSDKYAAKHCKQLIRYLRYVLDFPAIKHVVGKRMTLSGEAYLFIDWDPEKGELFPEVNEVVQAGEKPQIIDEESGDMLEVPEEYWRMGEVSLWCPKSANVYLDPVPSKEYDDCNWMLVKKAVHVDFLKKYYPEQADNLTAGVGSGNEYDTSSDYRLSIDSKSTFGLPEGYLWLWTLWHKGTKCVPEGRIMVFTETALLKNEPHPFADKEFPCIRITDVDSDDDVYGHALFSQARSLNGIYNNLHSMAYRYAVLLGPPRWVYPETAHVKPETLGNDTVGLKYRGAIPPRIETAPPMSQELFAHMAQVKEELRQVMGVFPMAQGNVPPNIRAGVSMLFMDEKANQRFAAEKTKHGKFVRLVWRKIFDRVRQFYPQDEQRKIAIFGKDSQGDIQDFDPTVLNSVSDIRLQEAPALPESKAARTQFLLDIDQQKPLPEAEFFEYLQLATPEAHISDVTKAKESADFENDRALSGESDFGMPLPFEDHIAHVIRHYVLIQDRSFKKLDEKIQAAFLEHIKLHEYYAIQQAFIDFDLSKPFHPVKAELLVQIPLFPSVFSPNTDAAEMQAELENAQLEMMKEQLENPQGALESIVGEQQGEPGQEEPLSPEDEGQ